MEDVLRAGFALLVLVGLPLGMRLLGWAAAHWAKRRYEEREAQRHHQEALANYREAQRNRPEVTWIARWE